MEQPKNFALFTKHKPEEIKPEGTSDGYLKAFGGHALTHQLSRMIASTDYKDWKKARNVLRHSDKRGQ